MAIKRFSDSRLCHGVPNHLGNPTQIALWKKKIAKQNKKKTCLGLQSSIRWGRNWENHIPDHGACLRQDNFKKKNVTDAAQTY